MPRPELFDTAVARALSYAERLGALDGERNATTLHNVLELWYLKTRFAYRVPLEQVVAALMQYPGPEHYWAGGREGNWHPGVKPQP